MLAWLTFSAVLAVAVATRYVPTAEDLRAAFDQGQRFYASGAYDQAIERYEHVATSRSELLDEKAIRVGVGDVDAPQDEVARYQIGNALFKMAEEAQQRASEAPQDAGRRRALAEADSLFGRATDYFLDTERVATEPGLRALARSRVLTCRYRMRDYRGTILQARELLARYPASAHVEQALYDIGWSHYEMEEYDQSLAAFDSLVARFPGGYRANRARFQMGEACFALARYAEAITHFRSLVESEGLEQMSERQILQMKREKLAGLVDETALDLAAKALIRIGMCHERLGDYAAAARAFERIAAQFADERRLVEEAYRRQADMYWAQGDFEACIQVYRRAIESQDDVAGRARTQLLLANRYYETGHFAAAIAEYNAYRYAYPQLAAQVGLPLPGVGLQIARAWFGQAEQAEGPASGEHLRQAELELRRSLAAFGDSPLAPELRFNLGLALQRQGGAQRLAEALAVFTALYEALGTGGLGRSALFQMARLWLEQGELERAAAAYRDLVAAFGEAAEADVARLELGLARREAGQWEEGVRELLAVRPASTLYTRSRLEAGQMLSDQGQRERAVAVFGEGLERARDPGERALFHYLLGATQAQLERQEEALASFAQALAGADAELAERAWYGRGVAAYRLERYADAVAYLDRPWADREIAGPARRLLAAAHAALGQSAAATDAYRALAQEATTPLERAEYTLAMAEIAYRQGAYERAIVASQDLQEQEFAEAEPTPERPYLLGEKASFLIADARTRLEDFAGAGSEALAGLERFPNGFYAGDLLFLAGMSALQLGRHEEARERLEEMLGRFPHSSNAPYARYYLAYAFFNQTRFAPALPHFQKLAEEHPDLDVAPDALFRAAECHYNLEDYARAAALYRRVLETYPHSPLREDAVYNLGWCALNAVPAGQETADMTPVKRAFTEYLAAYPQGRYVATAQYTLGEIHFNEGDYDGAHALFTRIQRDFPQSEAAAQAGQFMPQVLEAVAYRAYAAIAADLDRALEEEDEDTLRQLIVRLEAVWKEYPQTSAGVGAKLNVGVCYQNLREWKAAMQTFETIIAAGEQGNEQVTEQVRDFSQRRRNMIASKYL
ncbi:MAG: tetratricopeptide repeat protein [Candidatus Latescibacterota bacterium]